MLSRSIFAFPLSLLIIFSSAAQAEILRCNGIEALTLNESGTLYNGNMSIGKNKTFTVDTSSGQITNAKDGAMHTKGASKVEVINSGTGSFGRYTSYAYHPKGKKEMYGKIYKTKARIGLLEINLRDASKPFVYTSGTGWILSGTCSA